MRDNAMTIGEHIDYWIKSSNDDFEVFNVLINSKKYLHAMFFAHLILEKLLKAHWIKDNINSVPPKSHNLVLLLRQTNLDFTDEQMSLLAVMNDFQIEARYPDYKLKIHKLLSDEYINNILPQFFGMRKCLLNSII